jgi:hypothetical protein
MPWSIGDLKLRATEVTSKQSQGTKKKKKKGNPVSNQKEKQIQKPAAKLEAELGESCRREGGRIVGVRGVKDTTRNLQNRLTGPIVVHRD